tara:strand:+ start:1006 stop:2676 length:1671 start_codon:yes stop_codon:yes gene_type:complete
MKIGRYEIKFTVDNSKANEEIDETNKKLEQQQKDFENINDAADKATGGMISGFKATKTAIIGAIKSLRTFGAVFKALGIGLLVAGIASLAAAFTSNEEGQNKFIKITKQIGVVVGNVTDILSSFGNALLNVGKYLGAKFRGDAEGAAEAVDGIKDSFKEATDGVKNFREETEKELAIVSKLADAQARGDKLQRKLIVERAKADRDRADLLEKAINLEDYNLKQRIGFLEEAGAIEEEITNKEINLARIRLNARVEENKLSGSTKEDLEEEAQLRADLIALETARLTKQKEVTSQIIAFRNEEQAKIDADKATADADKQKELDAEAAFTLAQREALAVSEDEKTQLEITKAQERYDALIEQARLYNGNVVALEEAKAEAIKVIEEKNQKDTGEIVEDGEKFKADTLLKFTALGIGIAMEGSNAAKALGIANAIISTYAGAADVLETETTLVGKIAGVATVLAAGFKMVQAIKQTQVPVLSVGGVAASGGSSPAPVIQPPSFNVVGDSPINQLTDAISGQTQQPVKAFVVASDVTTAQELERNRILTAGVGAIAQRGI